MRKLNCLSCCGLLLLLLVLPNCSESGSSAAQSKAASHGGKIETTYDGFSHETVMSLQKMRVSCSGIKDTFKDACVSMMVSLHCRGVQAFHVNYVTLQLVFETKAWDQRHALNQRQLSVVVNNETLLLGEMKLVSQQTGDSMTETLAISFPYEVFKQIAGAQFAEMQVGPSRFLLRNKNLEALRDLNGRVVIQQ